MSFQRRRCHLLESRERCNVAATWRARLPANSKWCPSGSWPPHVAMFINLDFQMCLLSQPGGGGGGDCNKTQCLLLKSQSCFMFIFTSGTKMQPNIWKHRQQKSSWWLSDVPTRLFTFKTTHKAAGSVGLSQRELKLSMQKYVQVRSSVFLSRQQKSFEGFSSQLKFDSQTERSIWNINIISTVMWNEAELRAKSNPFSYKPTFAFVTLNPEGNYPPIAFP